MESLSSLLRLNGLIDGPIENGKRAAVAVIDDHPVSRTAIARLVADVDRSIDVHEFAAPAEALGWLERSRPALVVTDYQMPGMDGIDFVRKLRRLPSTQWTPIILVTISEDRQVKKRALEAGATDFLNKPIDHDECRARCRNLLVLSTYQSLLLEQLAIQTAHIRKLAGDSNNSLKDSLEEVGALADNGPYVALEYQELYKITSTLAAVDQLLAPWRGSQGMLEAMLKRPLQGRIPRQP